MTDRDKEISESLKRLAKAAEEIARLLRATGDQAARLSATFSEINDKKSEWRDYPDAPYDN